MFIAIRFFLKCDNLVIIHYVCSILVSDIQGPVENYNGNVNLEEFWESLSSDMIGRGFVASMTTLFVFITGKLVKNANVNTMLFFVFRW